MSLRLGRYGGGRLKRIGSLWHGSRTEEVHAVILEIDGSLSIISGRERRSESALDDVRRAS
jgi:hypothetical protein